MYFFYKYREFKETHCSFASKKELYFSSPDGFNDPFDANLCPHEFANEVEFNGYFTKRDMFGQFRAFWKSDIMRRGIFCVSTRCDIMTMWSHYADSHRGFCIGFRSDFFSHINFKSVECARKGANFFGEVRYMEDHPYKDLYDDYDPNLVGDFAGHFASSVAFARAALLSKHKSWCYEKEYRAVSQCNCAYPIDPIAIDHIIFGFSSSEENVLGMREILSSCGFNHVRLFRAVRAQAALRLAFLDMRTGAVVDEIPPA